MEKRDPRVVPMAEMLLLISEKSTDSCVVAKSILRSEVRKTNGSTISHSQSLRASYM